MLIQGAGALPAVLSTTEVCKFLRHREVAGDPLHLAWWLAAVEGLERRDLHGLRWEDVDLDGAVLCLRRERVQVGGRVVERPTNLREHPTSTGTVETLAASARRGRYVVVDSNTGAPFRQMSTFLRRLREACDNAGVPYVGYSGLRGAARSAAIEGSSRAGR